LRILLLDIETAPHKVYSWGLWNQDINPDNIIEQGYTLCWAAKWRGQKQVMFNSIHESSRKKMVREVYDLICDADAIVHYNGTKFDMPILNQEFLFDSLDPPSSYSDIDLLKTARKQFRLPSNKLDYVAQYLGLGEKTKHKGMALWHDCMDGCPKAWKIMKRYNIQDVNLTEKVYEVLLPWIHNHPNWGHFVDGVKIVCRNCGSDRVKKNGIENKTIVPYQRYRCLRCGTPLKGRTKLIEDEQGRELPQPSTR
jgi:DNA polymerase elongation subunit (family B)/DNA-directed RNA polymerase subunit RPC12/RpoP